ncbi:unnamed protein product [Didymodactylos carnosus]|uniref:Uncharacterized protein n=1 Tax=Didymodactylos carnosus TaxID=1234261 RepID=A0A814VU96_9BILA|nr:unnamed protein product [Didymodactylos carnosus]CAF1321840.1 unnamed protein product [Didymodactylos carnosus]CAF3957619.1 unnamed protein product [Didymodactylos carnosus]CAF4132054.1 unnamed protein product [Didymodactylos carnosus]
MMKSNSRDGLTEGEGICYYPRDSGVVSYRGEYHRGRRHGNGTLVWRDGRTYTGKFANDRRGGIGTMTYRDGSTYTGAFVKGRRQGKGQRTYANGSTYQGSYENDVKQGLFVVHNGNGDRTIEVYDKGELKKRSSSRLRSNSVSNDYGVFSKRTNSTSSV